MRTRRVQISPLAEQAIEPNGSNSLVKHPGAGQGSQASFEPRHRAGAGELRLFSPLHYEPDYAYPLIVWLHSEGDDANQLLRVMPEISLRNFAAVAPQGNRGNRHAGFGWSQTSDGIESSCEAVVAAIDHARLKLKIASHRIFLAGSGTGGTMALRLGFLLSQIVAGVISVDGPLPVGESPFSDWRNSRKVPVMWAQLRGSLSLDEDSLCSQLKLLHAAGVDVELRQYPFGDGLPAAVLADANRWIMNQIATVIA